MVIQLKDFDSADDADKQGKAIFGEGRYEVVKVHRPPSLIPLSGGTATHQNCDVKFVAQSLM